MTGQMVRYYFHIRSPQRFEVDTEGVEFASLQEAIADAAQGGRELLADASLEGRSPHADSIFEITDLSGKLLAEVPFLPAPPKK